MGYDAQAGRAYNIATNVESMKNILSKNFLDDDIMLYRGVSENEFNSLKSNNVFKNFLSTSFSEDIAKDFAAFNVEENLSPREYYVNIKAPKKTQGVYIDGKGAYEDEREFILNAGQKYKIIEVKDNTIYLEVIIDE